MNSLTDSAATDSVIIDQQTTSDAIAAQQSKLSQLTFTYQQYQRSLQSQGQGTPESLEKKMTSVTTGLAEVKAMSDNIKERTEPSIVEVMVQGK